ncbi:site-2 protease family protein [Actinomadura gamaensis]|uniref:Zinc metalloprotease n=1 Tax=Actinomadura gamaensis TaxID=1763541 RepID=A0ABV9TZW1_9ACTN
MGLHWSVLVILALVTVELAYGVLPAARPGLTAGVYLLAALPVAVAFFACLLAHELAHCVLARRAGLRVKAVTLWMLGGVSELGGEAPTPRDDLRIAVAGPATSLLLGLVTGAVAASAADAPRLLSYDLSWLAWMNVFLAAFNLLPGAPLDGGRVLRALLWRRHGDRARADRAATTTGRVIGTVVMGAGLAEVLLGSAAGIWLLLLGWFLTQASRTESMAREFGALLQGVRAGDVMTAGPETAAAWTTVADFARDVLSTSHQTVFPVVDADARPVGAVDLALLDRLLALRRASSRLDAVATPVPSEYQVSAAVPARALLERRPLAGGLLALVVSDGRLVGMVTVEDVNRALRRRRLSTALPQPTP